MKSTVLSMLVLSALLPGAALFHAGPAQAAFVTQLDITGGSVSLNFGKFGSVSGNFAQDGQLVMGQYQPLPNIFPPITVGGHTFSLFTSDQAFSGFPTGAPAPTGTTSDSTITVDLRSLFAGVTGPFLNASWNIGEPATGTFNATTSVFDLAWTKPFTGLGVPFLTSGSFSLRGTAHVAVAVAPVPVPAAVLLFGSGLCGIVGMVVRRQGPFKRQDVGFESGTPQAEQMSSSIVFLVSSDRTFAGDIGEQLRRPGYCVRTLASVTELLETAQQSPPALILVDRRVSDWDMLRTDRALSHVPVITLAPTEQSATDGDLIEDLERGADGAYSCRDGHRLFLAVIGAYFRRAGHDCARRGVYQVGDVQLDADTHELTIAGASIQLSPKQFGILHAFMSAPSKVFTRSELIDRVWGPGFAIGEHTLDVHIHALRQLLNRDSKQRCRLIAIKGVGFKLKMLQPSIPVLPLGAELPTVSTARPARHVGAVHDPIARSTAVAIPAKVRRGAALRRSVRRRLGQSRAEIPFVRRGYEAVSVG